MWKLVISCFYFVLVTCATWNQAMLHRFQNFFSWDFQRHLDAAPSIWALHLHVPDHGVGKPAHHPGPQLRLPPPHTHVLLPLQPVPGRHLFHFYHHPEDAGEHPDTEQRHHLCRCITQMYFFMLFAVLDDFILIVMAYDRYVAICHPLHYTVICTPSSMDC